MKVCVNPDLFFVFSECLYLVTLNSFIPIKIFKVFYDVSISAKLGQPREHARCRNMCPFKRT